jgi:hypothetical protein
MAASPAASAQEGGILIVQSFYGGDSRGCDPTAAVARSCTGKASCSIAAGNALCGDPEPGAVKRLRVVFRCGRHGGDRTVEAIEHAAPLQIACTTLGIQAVAYGERQAFCDATSPVASRCNREESCSLTIDNGLCGDPLPNVGKVAHITFKCNDQQRFVTAREHTSVTLTCR